MPEREVGVPLVIERYPLLPLGVRNGFVVWDDRDDLAVAAVLPPVIGMGFVRDVHPDPVTRGEPLAVV